MPNDMRDRLIELIRKAKKNTKGANCDLEREMLFADFLLANGVIVPPCKVGDTVYFILEDKMVEGGFYVTPAHTVTEVGSKGFWLSSFVPAEDDMSDFNVWEEIGKTVFLTREEAKQALKEGADNA